MKKTAFTSTFLLLLFVLVAGLISAIVAVPEDKTACVKRFDKVIKIYEAPGLYFKVPMLDNVVYLPNNELTYNLSPSDVLTLDKKAMTVSSYAVWQITEPLKFLQTAGNTGESERRLDANVYNAVKNLLSSLNQSEAISSRGSELNITITEKVRPQMEYYGIRVIDVQIKQFDLPQDNKEAVYTRMISERSRIAAQYTAEGKEEAEIIKNTADKEALLILSKAQATAAQTVAEGESEYMRILAEAYAGEDRAEFYEFIRGMDALKLAMQGDKTLILPLDSPLAKWFVGLN